MLLTAVSSIALALGFAVSPANAAPSPSTLYAGGPAGSTTNCTGPIRLYSDSAHTVAVTDITGGGSASFQNDCTSEALYLTFGSSTSSVSGSDFIAGGIARNTTSLMFTTSATLSLYLCAPAMNSGSTANCSDTLTRSLEQTVPITVVSSGGGVGRGLYPLGGASVTGNLTLNSVLTATNGTWSLTPGGAAITPASMSYAWFVCDASDANSTDIVNSRTEPPCLIALNDPRVLADGNSVSTTGSSYSSATLTLNQSLMTALNGKYLAVAFRPTAGAAFGNLLLPTCGAIGTATSCSVSYGTTPAVTTPAVTTKPKQAASTAPAKGTAAALATIPKASKAPTVKFGSGARSLGESTKKSLKKVATIAKDGYGVRITGAAGMQAGVPRDFVNALATKRAMDIRAYLIKQGVPKEDIIIKTEVFPIGKTPSTLVKIETLS